MKNVCRFRKKLFFADYRFSGENYIIFCELKEENKNYIRVYQYNLSDVKFSTILNEEVESIEASLIKTTINNGILTIKRSERLFIFDLRNGQLKSYIPDNLIFFFETEYRDFYLKTENNETSILFFEKVE